VRDPQDRLSLLMADHRHRRTERLLLDAVTKADLDELFALHADPGVWRHFPSARHTDRERTAAMLDRIERDWAADGLGFWSIRVAADAEPSDSGGFGDAIIGIGGCAIRHDVVWNLYYRFTPAAWGHGYAGEMIAAARAAADDVRADLPVIAYLVEHNVGSRRAAERAGLQLVWRGPDFGNPDPAAIRLIYADRALGPEVLDVLTIHA
jgi:RimJ/RimL family protein N-acetyltransferase